MNRLILIFLFSLILISSCFSKAYKGAELRTIEAFKYGRFEVCYLPPAATGVLANFFTYHDFTTGTIEWNEIDIEILGRYEDDVQCTIIGPRQFIYNSHSVVNFNPTEDYHVYAFEWTPDYVAWFIDGTEIYRQTDEHISQLIFPQQLMLNIWAPDGNGTWPGKWDPDILPVFAYYDWVSYAAFAPDSGDTGTDNNFKKQWQDDFDSWDQTRWSKATHTWGGNRVDFMTENSVFIDGKMILCLTDENNLGYVDNTPPDILWARARRNKLTVRFSEKVDSTAAQIPANYSISGITITEAKLLKDQRTAEVTISELDPSKSYNLVVFGIKDTPPGTNTKTFTSESIIQAKDVTFPLKINVGGEAIYNGEYLEDRVWGPDAEYGHMDGYDDVWPETDIQGTEMDSLYFNSVHEMVKYKIRVPNGIYDVMLHMSENKYSESGERVFSVAIERQDIVTNLDIYNEVGQFHAYNLEARNVQVEDGIIDIHFYNWKNKPTLSGLTINQISTSINSKPGTGDLKFELNQNYPNPFNQKTTIGYSIPTKATVTLDIYNVLGQKLDTLNFGIKESGDHKFNYLADALGSGLYLYKISAKHEKGIFENSGKMLLIK